MRSRIGKLNAVQFVEARASELISDPCDHMLLGKILSFRLTHLRPLSRKFAFLGSVITFRETLVC